MANPRLPNITEAEQELLYEKLNIYNQGKASYKEAGCYLVVLPREGHPNYSLWFYTPLDVYKRQMNTGIINACVNTVNESCGLALAAE